MNKKKCLAGYMSILKSIPCDVSPVPERNEPKVSPVNGVVQPSVQPPPERQGRITNLTKKLKTLLDALIRLNCSLHFRRPVNAIKLQVYDYHTCIGMPMDLTTVKRRLENGYYMRAAEALEDLVLMFANCRTFNSPTSPVVEDGIALCNHLCQRLGKLQLEQQSEYAEEQRPKGKGRKGAKAKKPPAKQPPIQEPIFQQPNLQQPIVQQPILQQHIVQNLTIPEPTMNKPIRKQPIVQQMTSQDPVFQELIVQEPFFQEPVLQQPKVQQPTPQDLIVQEPILQEPSSQALIVQEPILQEPVLQQPTFQEPSFQKPILQQPIGQQTTSHEVLIQRFQELIVHEPTFQQPILQQPIVQQPTYQEPNFKESTFEEPILQPPIFQQPIVQQPSLQQPTVQQMTPDSRSSARRGRMRGSIRGPRARHVSSPVSSPVCGPVPGPACGPVPGPVRGPVRGRGRGRGRGRSQGAQGAQPPPPEELPGEEVHEMFKLSYHVAEETTYDGNYVDFEIERSHSLDLHRRLRDSPVCWAFNSSALWEKCGENPLYDHDEDPLDWPKLETMLLGKEFVSFDWFLQRLHKMLENAMSCFVINPSVRLSALRTKALIQKLEPKCQRRLMDAKAKALLAVRLKVEGVRALKVGSKQVYNN